MTNVPYSFTLVAVVILFNLHILFIVPNIAEASPILRFMSFVQRPSSVITPPMQTKSVTCSSVSPSIFISTVFCCFPIVIVFVFSTLILSPNLWLLLCISYVSSWSCPSSSATRSMSSANLRLLTVCPLTLAPASVDFKAKLIIASRIRLNRYGDSPHSCLTPTVTLNQCFPTFSQPRHTFLEPLTRRHTAFMALNLYTRLTHDV